jgi:ribosomal protein L35
MLHHATRNHCLGLTDTGQYSQSTRSHLEPHPDSKHYIRALKGRKLVAERTHMMLFRCLQTLAPRPGP